MSRMGRRHGAALVLVSLLLPGVLVTTDATMSLPKCFGELSTIIGTEGDDTLSGTAERCDHQPRRQGHHHRCRP